MVFKFVGLGGALSAPLVLYFKAASAGAACAGGQRVLDAVQECDRAEISGEACRIELVRGMPPMIRAACAA